MNKTLKLSIFAMVCGVIGLLAVCSEGEHSGKKVAIVDSRAVEAADIKVVSDVLGVFKPLGNGMLPLAPALEGRQDVVHLVLPDELQSRKWACVMHAIYSMIRFEHALDSGISGSLDPDTFQRLCYDTMENPKKSGTSEEMRPISGSLVKNPVVYLSDPIGELALDRMEGDGYRLVNEETSCIVIGRPHPVKNIQAPEGVSFDVPYSLEYLNSNERRVDELFNQGYAQELARFMPRVREYLNQEGLRIVHFACPAPRHVFAAVIVKDVHGEKTMAILDNMNKSHKAESRSEVVLSYLYEKLMA